MKRITDYGQLKKGDLIMIIGRSDKYTYPSISVKDVIMDSESEEILINKKNNYYFITSMLIKGESWAKEVYKL